MTDPGDKADPRVALRAAAGSLRRLLDGAGTPDSPRHAVRNTIAMLRTIVHRSAESADESDTPTSRIRTSA